MDRSGESLSLLSDGLADAVERVSPAVVRLYGRRRRPASGVVFADGMVLTASHAVEREEDLSVELHDGRTLAANFVGRDAGSDLTVLAVEELGVEAATPVEGEARVGQLALAVGRSGRDRGVKATFGIVGAVGGPLRTRWGGRLDRYIQTDATPYPGLSGGALVNVHGRVMGVVTSGTSRGISLAVPADLAWRTASTLAEQGSVKRGYLGVLSQPVRLPESHKAGLEQNGGLLVGGVEEGSPADGGGVMLGDVMVSLEGHAVEDTEDLLSLLVGDRVGRGVTVEVLRGGELVTLQVTVGERG
jgi:S1-C subfamily serine protease